MAETLPIGEYLVRKELISPRALAQVLKEQPVKRQRLISMLILRAELEIDDGATCLSEQMGYTAAFERHLERRDTKAAKLLPGALCAQHAIIAIGKTAGGRLIVGARDPSTALQAELERATQLTIELAVVPAILIERLVRATFSLAIEQTPVFPASQASMHRARSVSALFADTQPPKPIELDPPTVIPGPRPSAPKVMIPERKSGPIAAISDLDSAPILLDRPKRPTGQEAAVAAPPERSEVQKTQLGLPVHRAPAAVPEPTQPLAKVAQPAAPKVRPPTQPPAPPPARPSTPAPTATQPGVVPASRTTQPGTGAPRAQPPGPPPNARPPTQPPAPPPPRPSQPPGPPPAARPSQPPMRPPTPSPTAKPARSMFDEVTRPAVEASREEVTVTRLAGEPSREEVTVTRLAAEPGANEVTRPAAPIDPETGLPPKPTGRQQSPTAPAPNQAVPEDARPPDRRQGPTRPTPNVPIPDEARPPAAEAPPGSIALADLAVEAGATASDPAVKLAPAPSQRPIERPRTVSESFSDLLDEPPMAVTQPLPAPPKPRAATEQPAPRVSAPSLPPPPPAPIRPGSEPAASSPPALPSTGTAPPKPPPAPGTGSIEAVCKEIERAISRATADRVLITFAGSRFKAALLVMVADDVARGARGQGPRLQAVQTIVLPIEAPSIIQVAHDTRALTREVPSSPTQDRIGELLQSTAPLAVPVIVDDAVVAVVVVGDATDTPVADDDFQKVVLAFATAYKRLYKAK